MNLFYLRINEDYTSGEIARFRIMSYPLLFSALQPCKHRISYLGLLRSRPDPFHKSTIEQDKTSTSGKGLTIFCLTHSFKPTIKPVCEWRGASTPARLYKERRLRVYKTNVCWFALWFS